MRTEQKTLYKRKCHGSLLDQRKEITKQDATFNKGHPKSLKSAAYYPCVLDLYVVGTLKLWELGGRFACALIVTYNNILLRQPFN